MSVQKKEKGADVDAPAENLTIPTTTSDIAYTSAAKRNVYDFMDDTYYGEGGYRSGTYLIPHNRELFYEGRRDGCFFKNYTFPIVSATCDMVFNSDIKRVVTEGDTVKTEGLYLNAFVDDATNGGDSLKSFIEDVVCTAWRHGVTFTVIDNFREQPEVKDDALKSRTLPYAYNYKAQQVQAYEADRFGNLEWIRFIDDVQKDSSGEKVEIYAYWDDEVFKKQMKVKGTTSAKPKFVDIEEPFYHGVGRIPVVMTFTTKRRNKRDIMVSPPFYDIARINHAIFNKDSEIRDQERAQGFAVFYVQTETPGDLNIGTHNVVYMPMKATIAPGFASPPPGILEGLVKNGIALREDLFMIAGQRGVTGVQSQKSGLAKEWDFIAHESILKKTAKIAEATEVEIIDIVERYTEEGATYNAEYPSSFKPNSDDEDIKICSDVLDMDLPPKASAMLKKKSFRIATKGQDESMVKDAMDEIDNDAAGDTRTPKPLVTG